MFLLRASSSALPVSASPSGLVALLPPSSWRPAELRFLPSRRGGQDPEKVGKATKLSDFSESLIDTLRQSGLSYCWHLPLFYTGKIPPHFPLSCESWTSSPFSSPGKSWRCFFPALPSRHGLNLGREGGRNAVYPQKMQFRAL